VTIGSLFSGIGGLELGLERAGLGAVVWQVERDAYCRHILARHWPEAQRFDDVRTVGRDNLAPVDVLCGGFPCQDLSAAGNGAGLEGARSGLWYEMRRVIEEIEPTWIVVENVAHTWRRYVPVVRRDLWGLGYASLPIRVRACDVGARHERRRVFLVAAVHPHGVELRQLAERIQAGRVDVRRGGQAESTADVADADSDGVSAGDAELARLAALREGWERDAARCPVAAAGPVAEPGGGRLEGEQHAGNGHDWATGDAVAPGFGHPPRPWMVRGVHGLPGGVDGPWRAAGWTGSRLRTARIHALGNAVVPQAAEAIGRMIASLAAGRP